LATLPGIITSKTAWVLSKPGDRVTEHVFELQFPREILMSLASGIFGTGSGRAIHESSPFDGNETKPFAQRDGEHTPTYVDARQQTEYPAFYHHQREVERR
jgi:hypothetical protein